jgi:hypothetical protein
MRWRLAAIRSRFHDPIAGRETMDENIAGFLCEALETEIGGVQVYETAIRCASNEDLREEWEKYLEETKRHVEVYTELLEELEIDPEMDVPGRQIVRAKAKSLVQAMQSALKAGDPDAAQIVAAECVVDAETKCHLNWELVGELGKKTKGESGKALREAYEEVEDEEDEHLYHTTGWARELWIERLGMRAQLPPPEEEKDVKTAIGAARAKKARKPGTKKAAEEEG